MTQPTGYREGVYLTLSNEEYHADPAISSSGIKKLLRSPEAYWDNSPLNPNREEQDETEALKVGKAYHTLVFEPEKFDFQIKKGVNKSGVAGWLGEGQYNEMTAMRDRLMRYKQIPFAISNGFAEVSVFWRDEDTGLMCRCRFDYWRIGFITDLKTEQEINKTSLQDVRYSFPKYAYDVSGAMYMEGSRNLKRMLRAGGCYIDPAISEDFIKSYLAQDKERFMFLYQEKTRPYEAQGRCISEHDEITRCGMEKFRRGLSIYQHYDQHYNGTPWESLEAEIVDLTIDDLSQSINYS